MVVSITILAIFMVQQIKVSTKYQQDALKYYQTSNRDKLTSLYNRNFFDFYLPEQMKISKLKQTSLFIALFDIDKFKAINDQFGHAEGDRTLQTVGQVMQDNFRKTDVLVRYGGDEFVIIFDDIQLNQITQMMQDLMDEIGKKGISISIGLTQLKIDDTYEIDMLRVDKAMYQAKKSKDHHMVIY